MKNKAGKPFRRMKIPPGLRMVLLILFLAVLSGFITFWISHGRVSVSLQNLPALAYESRHVVQMITTMAFRNAVMVAGISAGVGFVLLLTIRTSLRSLRVLRKGIEKIAEGQYDGMMDGGTNVEIKEVTDTLNQVCAYMQTSLVELKKLSEKYKRFVPHELFDLIGQKTVLDVDVGQYARKEIALTHTKISGFYRLTKEMDDKELLQFFNRFLTHTVKVVKKEGGFAEQYNRDGMTAIFSENTDSALVAALRMQEIFKKSAKKQISLMETIRIHTALHAENLMLGVIGVADRLEVTVISGDKDMVSLLCELSGELGAFVIVTEPAFCRIKQKEMFQFRYLGKVIVTERGIEIGLYDFYDEDPDLVRNGKRMSQEVFDRGVEMFYQRQFAYARCAFLESLRVFAGDKAAITYLFLCDRYVRGEAPTEPLGIVG